MGRGRNNRNQHTTAKKAIDENGLLLEMREVFRNVQKNTSYHEKCLKLFQDLFPLIEEDKFFDCFIKCMEKPLQIGERNHFVEKTLDFAAKFCTSFGEIPDSENDDMLVMHPFLARVFAFALRYHSSNSPDFRYRICQFVNKMLVCLGEQAELDDILCDNIQRAMLDRLQDPKSKVRTQAVIALHRLQNPSDENDPVTKSYLFHMEKDPSPQVRRAVVNNLARSMPAFPKVLARLRDVDEKVRRDAYNFIGMYSVKNFRIVQRMSLLKSGLTDRSDLVKRCVSEVLIPKWFVHYERSYFDFLKAIRVDISSKTIKESIEVSKLLLNVFVEDSSANEIIEVLQLDERKLLKPEFLDHEHIIFWRYLVEFFHGQGAAGEEYLDDILPTLSDFCMFIKSFVGKNTTPDSKFLEENIYQSAFQLFFEMIDYFDLSDEVGRSNLMKLLKDLLLKESLNTGTIDVIIENVLERLIPQSKERITIILELITEIIEPMEEEELAESEDIKRRREVKLHELRFKLNCLNDDEEIAVSEKNYIEAAKIKEQISKVKGELKELTNIPAPVVQVRKRTNEDDQVLKALEIIKAMFQSKTIRELSPELRILQQNFIIENCTKSNLAVKIESTALQCLGLCAYLDEELAKTVMPKFFYRIMAYQHKLTMEREIVKTSLQVVYDLLLVYGSGTFQPPTNDTVAHSNNGAANKTKRPLYDETKFNNDTSDDDDDDEDEIDTQRNVNFSLSIATINEIISCCLSFLDDECMEIRTISARGLILLLVCGKFKSTEVLTRLIIAWFNPATEQDSEMRQVLGVMLNNFAMKTSGSQEELAKAFLPTIRTILDAPATSPLAQVDIDTVINFLLTHTQPEFNTVDNANVHNYLALTLCEEILKNGDNETREKKHLMKCLPNLLVAKDDTALKHDLQNLCIKIIEVTKNKNMIRYVKKFMQQLQQTAGPDENTEHYPSDQENSNNLSKKDLSNTSTSSTSNISQLKKDLLNKSLRVILTPLEEEKEMDINCSSSAGSSSPIPNEEQFNLSTSEPEEEDSDTSSSSEDENQPLRISVQIHNQPSLRRSRKTSLRRSRNS